MGDGVAARLGRLGRACARHRWRTILVWSLAIVGLVAAAVAVGGQTEDVYTIPGSSAQRADDSVDYVSSGIGAIHDQIVALADAAPDLPHEFERAAARVAAIDPDAGRGQAFLNLGIFGDPYYVAARSNS